MLWLLGKGVLSPLALNASQWPLGTDVDVRGLTDDKDDGFYHQSRVLYGDKFANVERMADVLHDKMFPAPVIVAGILSSKNGLKEAFNFTKLLVAKNGVEAVLCVASPLPLDNCFELDGWVCGVQRINSSLFTEFESVTYITTFVRRPGMSGGFIAGRIQACMTEMKTKLHWKGVCRIQDEPLISGPVLSDKHPMKNHQTMLLAGVEKLKRDSDDKKVWYVDAAKKIGKVSTRMPDVSGSSCLMAIHGSKCGTVSVAEALGYEEGAFNVSLLKKGTQQCLIAGSLPAMLVAVMLHGSKELMQCNL